MLDVDDEALAAGLVPVVDAVEGPDLPGGNAVLGEAREQGVEGEVGERGVDGVDDGLAVLHALAVRGEPRCGRVDPEAQRELLPQPLAAAGELDHPVGAGEQAVGADRRVVVASGLRHLAGHGVPGALEGVDPDDRGEQRGAHLTADAGAVALVERGDDTVGAVHPGEEVADGDPDALRVVGVGAGERHQAALALGDLVVPGAAALGTVVAEPADPQDDEARVELVQALDGEAEPVEDAGTEVLEEDVGPGHQPRQDVASGVALEVELDGLLVPVAGQEVRGHRLVVGPDEGRAPAARLVTRTRALDLDDAGTHVAEHHPAVRPGQGTGQVDDDDVVEGSAHDGLLVRRCPANLATTAPGPVRQAGPSSGTPAL